MEPNTPELSSPPEQPVTPPKSHLPLLILILVIIIVGAFAYTKRDNSTQEQTPAGTTSTPQGSTAQNFTPEAKEAIEKFIHTRIDILSPVSAATGTKFVVSSVEHKDAGEVIVVYSDTTATHTARGVFAVPKPKQVLIVSFDLVTSSVFAPVSNPEEQKLVEEYVKEHLSTLSPEKEVLGGEFFVTKIRFLSSGAALVEYEDGHNAYTAEVTYEVKAGKEIDVIEWRMLAK